MTQMIFVNLPVADVAKATAFYQAIGFTQDPRFSADHASAMQLSDSIVFMLLNHEFFQSFTPRPMGDPRASTQALFALSRDSREAVDAIVEQAVAAGGKADIRPAQDMGFMYGRSFEDLDGNIFEPVFMDMAAFAEAGEAAHEHA